MDFIDNILNDVKFRLDPGAEFYHKVAKAHQAILECFKQKDGVGARKAIVQDLLEVGNDLAMLSGTQPFNPTMLLDENLPLASQRAPLSLDHTPLEVLSTDLQRIFGEEVAGRLNEKGVVFRRIGTGELYFIALGRQEGSRYGSDPLR